MHALTDSHCHLADTELAGDVDGVLARAATAGVTRIVSVGALGPIAADRLTVEIAERHDNVYAAVGVHPHNARECDSARIAALREIASSKKVVAIGETGLDFHYMHSEPQAQEDSLCRHLELAASLELPVVIHCRNGEERLVKIIDRTGMPEAGGVIHCFTGDEQAARQFVRLGFYISFSGIVTFKNAAGVRAAARIVPAERLLIETDAPYLAPEPNRGRRNEPALMVNTLKVLAEVRGADPAELGALTNANSSRLFRMADQRQN